MRAASVFFRGRALRSSSQVPYSAAKVWIGRGSLRSTYAATGPAKRISRGVVRVVIAETATATG